MREKIANKTLRWLMLVMLVPLSLGTSAKDNSGSNGAANGQPFQDLQAQIDAMQDQIDQLTAVVNQEPIQIDVDCAAGDTVNGAIASAGSAPNPWKLQLQEPVMKPSLSSEITSR